MLETLVSSRIRRTLLEHLLQHPAGRFYLRGLAKELTLAISPLRRELKRLEEQGMLSAYQEANIRFYVVDQTSAVFQQLRQAAGAPVAVVAQPNPSSFQAPPVAAVEPSPVVASTVINTKTVDRIRGARRPLPAWAAWAGALGFGMTAAALVLAVYIATVRERPKDLVGYQVRVARPSVVVQVRTESPSVTGQMHSTRWRLMPGAVGGFSSGASER
ncbi:MAG: winged helix-turn-helix transcriptional regulator [Candidatus Omnitrophica bacterium]|nr:winged helix-turn-helix transcriptional regulator [Candidatus Omnitrophota bacterium]